jgi:hypothetical protein
VYNLKVEKPDVRKVRTDGRKIVEMNVCEQYSLRKNQSVMSGTLKLMG